MTPLACAVYQILRRRIKLPDPRITYGELARNLRARGGKFERVTHRSRELYASLWEIGDECRRLGLPPLPALVVRADSRTPGEAYYEGMASPYRGDRLAQWRRDVDAVRQARYPRL